MPNCSPDLSYMHDEFVELMWDNGPVMQCQGAPSNNRPRKSSIFTSLLPSAGGFTDKDAKDSNNFFPKIGPFRETEPKSNDFPPSGSLSCFGTNGHNDDIVRWIYPMEDPIHNDYCTQLLDDQPGVKLNFSAHTETNIVPVIRDQTVVDSHSVEQGRASQFKSLAQNAKSTEMDVSIGINSRGHRERGVSAMNFSHFTRPVALTRANRPECYNKATYATTSNPMESTVMCGLSSVVRIQDQPSSGQLCGDLASSPRHGQEMNLPGEPKAPCEGEILKSKRNSNTSHASNKSPEGIHTSNFGANFGKGNETVIASSSGCSGCSAGTASDEHKRGEKKKRREGNESGYQSEDLEDESMYLKNSRTAQGKKKRSRAAEVHNLSERRRRDRINERMRALQELIPNCNKTDKASMLDEAIEYLKSLQMQVQIMAMGGGLYMSPIMMQHARAPAMAHYAPVGMGMGMGMGMSYGMGMYDMNGSPGCPFIPVSPMQGPQFVCSPMAGPPGLHRVPRPNSLQMYGISGQGFPVPMAHQAPSVSSADASDVPIAAEKCENQREQNKT